MGSEPIRVGRDPGSRAGAGRASVAIGFGSPAGDTGVTRLDLNDILIKHPQASFLMRCAGDDLQDMGIDSGDLLLVDRAITPAHGHVVVAVVEEEFVCRLLHKQGACFRLSSTRDGRTDRTAGDDPGLRDPAASRALRTHQAHAGTARGSAEFEVWGVVTQVIKAMPV